MNRDRFHSQNLELEAERGVLGSIMLDNAVLREVILILATEDFHHHAHQHVYSAVRDLYDRGEPVDTVRLDTSLSHLEEYQAAGGPRLLADLADSVAHAANARYYAEIVRAKSIERQIRRCRDGHQEPPSD
jgi:replicative DNA helicase